MFGDPERLVYQLHLLNDFLPVGQGRQAMGRVHRTVLQLIEDVVIDLRWRKGRVLMFRMARLTADFAPFTFPGRLGRRFDNVAGRRFRGIARVFRGRGQRLDQLLILSLRLGQTSLQLGGVRFQLGILRFQLPATFFPAEEHQDNGWQSTWRKSGRKA